MNKVMSLHDAVAQYIQTGDTICFGGFTTNRKPYAAMYEILRQGQTDFTVWAGPAGGDWDMMIGEGRVKAYINCYTANSGYTNVSRRFRAFIEQGKLTYEDYSQDVLMLQLHAASLGLPFLPVRLMQGSGLMQYWGITPEKRKEMPSVDDLKAVEMENPFLPLIGASLAKRAVCPSCHPIVESGLMDCAPVEVPRSVGDLRFMAHCAVQWPNIRFVGFEANEWLHDADRLIAFIGGAQIDPYGNVNSTCIYGKGDYIKPQTRFTGSGGANGIATYCNTIIMMQHQKRRFMDHIDYVTSPGWMDGPGGRERAGLPGNRGPQMVVTDLGILKFDEETKRMYLAYYYPFSSPEMVRENTGFDIDVSRAELMEGPGPDIIRMIREEIDPGQAFIKVPKA